MVFYTLGTYYKLGLHFDFHFYLLWIMLFILNFVWSISAFLTQMIAESIRLESNKTDFITSTKAKIIKQRQVCYVLSDFLLVYFAIFQLLSITLIFTSISQFLITPFINFSDIYIFIGNILVEQSLALTIHAIVSSFELVYSHFEDLTLEAQACLEDCSVKEERRKWKSLLRQLSTVKPFSARGYFDITKETLTSMSSVRYLLEIYNDDLSQIIEIISV